jgi:hypothetical protein
MKYEIKKWRLSGSIGLGAAILSATADFSNYGNSDINATTFGFYFGVGAEY